ncbi:MAG: hypothetical protein ACI8X5_000533 [Planctomycetota bacterium]|jgi:hypothetical protein
MIIELLGVLMAASACQISTPIYFDMETEASPLVAGHVRVQGKDSYDPIVDGVSKGVLRLRSY